MAGVAIFLGNNYWDEFMVAQSIKELMLADIFLVCILSREGSCVSPITTTAALGG